MSESEAKRAATEFEHRIKGTYEGIWRAIGWGDTWSVRDAGRYMTETLNELADWMENGRLRTGPVEKPGPTENQGVGVHQVGVVAAWCGVVCCL